MLAINEGSKKKPICHGDDYFMLNHLSIICLIAAESLFQHVDAILIMCFYWVCIVKLSPLVSDLCVNFLELSPLLVVLHSLTGKQSPVSTMFEMLIFSIITILYQSQTKLGKIARSCTNMYRTQTMTLTKINIGWRILWRNYWVLLHPNLNQTFDRIGWKKNTTL